MTNWLPIGGIHVSQTYLVIVIIIILFYYRYDLAELLLKLRQYDKAEKVLKVALEEEQSMYTLYDIL
jgi:hypothetical protein